MPPWLLKAAIQGTLSRLPNPQRWNRLLQKYVTGSLELSDEYFLEKWRQCERHVATYRRETGNGGGAFSALELGTGWFPITPIGLALSGAERVVSIDLQDLLAHERVVATLQRYARLIAAETITVADPDPIGRIEGLLDRAPSLGARELLAAVGVEARLADARDTGLASGSIDLICSNNTLEHIPREVIVDIFREFRRVLSARGIMSHHIDLADHYANFDSSITVYNFLRYSDRVWPLFNNDLQYQNRLRVSDFRDIHAESGWRISSEDNTSEPLEVLRRVPVADRFRHYDDEDLAVYSTWMTSRPAERADAAERTDGAASPGGD